MAAFTHYYLSKKHKNCPHLTLQGKMFSKQATSILVSVLFSCTFCLPCETTVDVYTWANLFGCVCTCALTELSENKWLCVLYAAEKDDRWWEGSRSFETCHSVPVYEPMTGDTHPSTSKFITVHHLPTCSVMTFSQSYKNPWKPVGINQCLSTFTAAARIHY